MSPAAETGNRESNVKARLEKAIEAGGKDASELVKDYIVADVDCLSAEERVTYLRRLGRAGYNFREEKRR